MARDPKDWSDLGAASGSGEDWSDLGASAGPKLPDNYPRASAAKRSARERFDDNFEQGRQQSLAGATGDAFASNLPAGAGDYARDRLKDENARYAAASDADPWYKADGGLLGKAEAGAATLGGLLAGGMTSPEALVGPGKTVLGRILGNAAVNAGLDVPVDEPLRPDLVIEYIPGLGPDAELGRLMDAFGKLYPAVG